VNTQCHSDSYKLLLFIELGAKLQSNKNASWLKSTSALMELKGNEENKHTLNKIGNSNSPNLSGQRWEFSG